MVSTYSAQSDAGCLGLACMVLNLATEPSVFQTESLARRIHVAAVFLLKLKNQRSINLALCFKCLNRKWLLPTPYKLHCPTLTGGRFSYWLHCCLTSQTQHRHSSGHVHKTICRWSRWQQGKQERHMFNTPMEVKIGAHKRCITS